jgi:hypothetical protein
LKEIGRAAFQKCGVKSIVIPSKAEKIGDNSFGGCLSLIEVIFESGCDLKEIGGWAFSICAIESITIPSKVEKIGANCFFIAIFLLK